MNAYRKDMELENFFQEELQEITHDLAAMENILHILLAKEKVNKT